MCDYDGPRYIGREGDEPEVPDPEASPPEGWFELGYHVDQPGVILMFSETTDETGMPLWERPFEGEGR